MVPAPDWEQKCKQLQQKREDAKWEVLQAMEGGQKQESLLEQYPNRGGARQQRLTVSQSWRLEVRDQAVSQPHSLRAGGENPSCLFGLRCLQAIRAVPWLTDASLHHRAVFSVSRHIFHPLCTSLCPTFPFIKTPVILGEGLP